MTVLLKKLTPKQARELRDAWERQALPVFRGIYQGQYDRITKVIRRVDDAALIEQFLAEQWLDEPRLVRAAARTWYDAIAFNLGQSALDDYELYASFDVLNELLFSLSNERAQYFANAMTRTSMRQTQVVIRQWLDDGGKRSELVERVARVWTGPRPEAAAVTETTYMAAHSKLTSWRAAGVWGYNVRTMNDSAVRDTHREVSAQGPYPLSDTQHAPPVNGDVNCRCIVIPFLDNPNNA